ncbi:MBL fold metallo-hydrolase [Mycolicibacterium conceptionense]|uniref:MBL fold metallo-hydrolase n=1 Tax=Mycolicibacterium conceptionense TaxID=451644 RepID=UPI00096F3280|nr:MBL fold metallo-hydrolase [Mycolicibacterium conceptionense]OMB86724.1 MBL fold metallo-hydrolase [Mycolicibacterium conceptionense]
MAAALSAITEHVHFAQTDLVNWTLVTDGTRVMLIDAGFPGQRKDVLGSVRQLGFGIEDIAAVLLTHAHIDHFGTAIWLAKTHGTPVFCHDAELGHAKREYLEQAAPADVVRNIWQPRWLKWAATITAKGGMNHDGIPTARALTDDDDLPGRPVPVPTPGHTGGHCSFIVDGVLVSGDALVTGHPLVTKGGPQLLPALFNHDEAGCLSSLKALAAVEAEVMLPGHGPMWRGSISDAASAAAARHT